MRRYTVPLAILFVAGSLCAQTGNKLVINTDSPEGKLIQQIGQESDLAKKISESEQFLTQYPKHDGVSWVYGQLVPAYTQHGDYDKALDAAAKLIALDPANLEIAYSALKASEAKKDPDLIVKWSLQTSQNAQKIVKASPPADADADEWKKRVDYARQVGTYAEYSLYAAALQQTDGHKTIALVEALEQSNPQSQYLPKVYGAYLVALNQTGQAAKVLPFAEHAIESDPTNEDLLLVLANGALNRKDNVKALQYASKLAEVMNAKPKPEGLPDAEWQQKKSACLGRAYWMLGAIHSDEKKYVDADRELRQALPYIQGNEQLMAGALFYLGVANYTLGKGRSRQRLADALKFSQQSAAIKSPYQAMARKNAQSIKTETGGR
jgi:tetratricopeptide (TPR) repeat protein